MTLMADRQYIILSFSRCSLKFIFRENNKQHICFLNFINLILIVISTIVTSSGVNLTAIVLWSYNFF